MESSRLRYRPVGAADVEALLAIVTEDHVRRYLFDGDSMTRAWCEDAVATSRRTFDDQGLGLWLVSEKGDGGPIGFCGYWTFDELGPEMQLLFAFTEPYTGRGYATEAATTLVATARAHGVDEIVSAADQPNTASIRVLEKLGFEQTGTAPGAFGDIVKFVLRPLH